MSSLNKVMLIGRLGQDPEVRYTQSNTAVATLNLATNERYKDSNGEYQDKTKFIPVILNSIKNKKGIPVYGKGENQREWLYVGATANIVCKLVTEECETKDIINLGSGVDLSNVKLIEHICEIIGTEPNEHINFVEDPRGNMHDLKYAVDNHGLECIVGEEYLNDLKLNFKLHLKETIEWFQKNQ